MKVPLFLCQSTLDALPTPRSTGSGSPRLPAFVQDFAVIILAAGALLALLLIWALFIRRRSRRHSDLRVVSHILEETPVEEPHGHRSHHHHHHHRRRRRRREHRPRNPTLSETGGLPPPRASDQLPPSL